MKEGLILKNKIKEFRTKKNLSQQDLANIVGVSRNTISSLEIGKYEPSAKLAYVISIALEKNFEEIFYFKKG